MSQQQSLSFASTSSCQPCQFCRKPPGAAGSKASCGFSCSKCNALTCAACFHPPLLVEDVEDRIRTRTLVCESCDFGEEVGVSGEKGECSVCCESREEGNPNFNFLGSVFIILEVGLSPCKKILNFPNPQLSFLVLPAVPLSTPHARRSTSRPQIFCVPFVLISSKVRQKLLGSQSGLRKSYGKGANVPY